jgi:hypothetical protein
MPCVDSSFFDRVHDIYDLKGRMGVTDYIDFLKRDEVPKNVMKGVDCYRRTFLTMKIGGIDLDTMKFFKTGQVFFERYTGEPYLASADFEGMFIWTTGGTTTIQYKLINDLVDGKLVKLEEEHRFNSSNCNVVVATMDYWENHFARIIQKNWRMCRYNPNYAICKKILNEQFDEYNKGIKE